MARFSIHFDKNIEVGLKKYVYGLDEATLQVESMKVLKISNM